jgi:hypothetical protein
VGAEGGLEGFDGFEEQVADGAALSGASPAMPSSTAMPLQASPSLSLTMGMCWLQ